MRKVTSKKDHYIVECRNEFQSTSVLRELENTESNYAPWRYVVQDNSASLDVYDFITEIPDKYSQLEIISFEEWQILPDEEPKDLVLPEKWGIIGCEELTKYFKENKINSLDGGYYNQYYFINSQGEWDCQLIQFKDDETKIITFEQFKEHVLGKENINKLNVILTDISDKVKEKLKERKIVGYKLVKEEYKEAFCRIMGVEEDFIYESLEEPYHFSFESSSKTTLEKLDILELWTEPVYEESTETKIVDYLAEQGIEINEQCASEIIEIVNNK